MQVKSLKSNTAIVSILITTAICSRLIPHPANFAPMMAVGIFGGAFFQDRKWALIIPLLATWLSDLVINNIVYAAYYSEFTWFYPGFYWQYVVYALTPWVATYIFREKITVRNLFVSGLGSGLFFFFVSNFGVWVSSTMYSSDAGGLLQCYLMGLPFLKGTLMGNIVYLLLLFGAYYFAELQIPSLRATSKIKLGWS